MALELPALVLRALGERPTGTARSLAKVGVEGEGSTPLLIDPRSVAMRGTDGSIATESAHNERIKGCLIPLR